MGPRDHDKKISDLQVLPSWLSTCPVRQLLAEIIRSCRKLSCQRLLSSRPFSGADGSPYDPALSSLETSYTDFLTHLVFQKCSIPDMGHLWGKDYTSVIKFPDMSQNSSFLTPHLWGERLHPNFHEKFPESTTSFSLEIHLSSRNPPFPMDSIPSNGPPMVVPRWHNLSPAPRPETKQTQRAIFTAQKKWLSKLNKSFQIAGSNWKKSLYWDYIIRIAVTQSDFKHNPMRNTERPMSPVGLGRSRHF